MIVYAWLFRVCPGPTWVKWVLTAALVAGVVFVLFEFVFPVWSDWLSDPVTDVGEVVSVGTGGSPATVG